MCAHVQCQVLYLTCGKSCYGKSQAVLSYAGLFYSAAKKRCAPNSTSGIATLLRPDNESVYELTSISVVLECVWLLTLQYLHIHIYFGQSCVIRPNSRGFLRAVGAWWRKIPTVICTGLCLLACRPSFTADKRRIRLLFI